MVSTLKAEFKKLLTVRSTYIVTSVMIALTILFTYLGTNAITKVEHTSPQTQKAATTTSKPIAPRSPDEEKKDERVIVIKDLPPEQIVTNINDGLQPLSIFIIVIVLLMMAHEFRYNTIYYTLTSSNSRSKVLTSKIVVGTAFVVFATLLTIAFNVATTYAAVHIKGLHITADGIHWGAIFARSLGYMIGYSLLGLAFITILRNLTAALVAVFILPTIDSIVGFILANHHIASAKFMPFASLDRIGSLTGVTGHAAIQNGVTLAHATIVFLCYLVGVWVLAWYLFLRRDAN